MKDIYVSKEAMEEVEEIAFKEMRADFLKEEKPKNGYRVFVPEYKRHVCMGLPSVILAKGDEVKEITGFEAFEYSE